VAGAVGQQCGAVDVAGEQLRYLGTRLPAVVVPQQSHRPPGQTDHARVPVQDHQLDPHRI
jgi:hypothetical protein